MAIAIDRPATGQLLLSSLATNWGIFIVRGVIALFFGSCMYLWPGPTLPVLVLLFGAYAMIDGVLMLGAAFRSIIRSGFGGLLVEALIRIGTGGVALVQPALGAVELVQLIAGMAIASGAAQLTSAFATRADVRGAWPLLGAGAISALFGTALMLRADAGAMALIFFIGLYALLYGVMMIVLGLRGGQLARAISGL